MVQEGVQWFGDTLDITATVGAAAPGGGTCVATALVAALPIAALADPGVLDNLRVLRAALSEHPAGRELVNVYRDSRVSQELLGVLSSHNALSREAVALVLAASRILVDVPGSGHKSIADLREVEALAARRALDDLLEFLPILRERSSTYSSGLLIIAEHCLRELRALLASAPVAVDDVSAS